MAITSTQTNDPYADLEKKKAVSDDLTTQYIQDSTKLQEKVINANKESVLSDIKQQKEYSEEDFRKEATAASVDYTRAVNPYGVNAENVAQSGLGKSGFAESSKVGMYNTYQVRVSNAINTNKRIQADFDNKMNDAKLNANTELAKVALSEYQTRIELLKADLDFQTNIVQARQAQSNWQTEYDRAVKQSDLEYKKWLETFEYSKKQDKQAQANWEKEYELTKKKINSSSGGGGSGGSSYPNITNTPKTPEAQKQQQQQQQQARNSVVQNNKQILTASSFNRDLDILVKHGQISTEEAKKATRQYNKDLLTKGLLGMWR